MSQPDLPTIVGERYRLQKTIGAGGMGVVYQAVDIQTDQPTAIKLLKPEAHTPDLLERFKREGEALRQLNHPNIVKVLTTFDENNQHYLVMEYVAGGSLADLLKRQPRLAIDQTLKIALEVADALSRAHHLKIIHRDIKPDNVLLAEDGTPRLTDFGVAHLANSKITQSGMVMGTYPYLCPEAFNGLPLDARADIWAFGVMLFEMLAEQRPFEGNSLAAIMMAVLTQPTPDLEAIRPDAPVALIDLIYRMLDKNPDERISSVRLVGAALESIISGVDTPIRPVVRLPAEDQALTVQISTPLSSSQTYTNLPPQATPFVGRDEELAELAKLVGSPVNRLVTILGTGGMGKTRLSLECAAHHIPHFSDGVYFVELAPLSSPEHIVTAVADAIGVQFAQGSEPKQQLLNAFHDRKMLLVMDNYEHLLEGAHIVREILGAAPNVKILVTSRERLNLSGETLFALAGMDFPNWETPEDALDYGAVKLFMQSALRAKPNFALVADDLNFLARICRLVAGMPLGIVLTAAWVSMLSLNEIADEIARSLDFLETDMQDIPERQRSVRRVFEYSYDRLTDEEQGVFRKLSIFRGGCTREAAQGVAGASLKTLMTLINKSLLRRDPNGRYQIHELLRQFGEQQLVNSGEVSVVQDAHATFFAHFLQRLWDDLKGRRQVEALAEIDPEDENLRLAWGWLVEHQRIRELGEAASSLWLHLEISTNAYDGVTMFGKAVEALRLLSSSDQNYWVLGHLLSRLAWFQASIGLIEKYNANTDEALAILQGADYQEETVLALYSITRWSGVFAQYAACEQAGEEAIRIAQDNVNVWVVRLASLCQGIGLYYAGKVRESRSQFEESLTLCLSAGDLWLAAYACIVLTLHAQDRQNFDQRNFQEVEKYARQGLQVFETLHNRFGIAQLCIWLGGSLAQQGRDAEAKPYFHRGFTISHNMGLARQMLVEIIESVYDYFSQADKPFAVELLGMILNNPACDKGLSGWAEVPITALKAELSPEVYESAWKRGSQWSLDQAVTLILARLR